MGFESRTIVNGSQLKQHSGQPVSIHLYVQRAEKDGHSFTGKSTDGQSIQVVLQQPLTELVNGWVEVIGMAGSNDTVRCQEVISYRSADNEDDFDAASHNMLCTFLANCKDIYRME